jgi:hypothetical protein
VELKRAARGSNPEKAVNRGLAGSFKIDRLNLTIR